MSVRAGFVGLLFVCSAFPPDCLAQGAVFDQTPTWSGPAERTISMALGDVDGDGDLDLVRGNLLQEPTLYLNTGNTFASSPVWVGPREGGQSAVALGDVDGDGDLDLVRGNLQQGATLYLNTGGTLVERTRKRPDLVDQLIDVAQFHSRHNRHDLAEKWARKAMAVAPYSVRPYNQLGWECWHQGRFAAARDAFLEAIHRSPNEYDSYRGLAQTLNSMSLPDSAETVRETWVRQRPGHADGWHLLGGIFQQHGKTNRAAGAYEKELELRPRSAGALNNLAILYGQMGRREKGIEMYKRAVAIDSTTAVAWMNLAVEYYTTGDDEQAWTAADKASQLVGASDLSSAGNDLTLAQIEKRSGKLEESKRHLALAEERITRALHDHPLDPRILASATAINGFAGNVEKARQYAAEEFRRQTGDPALIYTLASGLTLAGDRDGALDYLQKAITAGYSGRRALEDDPDLDGIRMDPRFADVVGKVQ